MLGRIGVLAFVLAGSCAPAGRRTTGPPATASMPSGYRVLAGNGWVFAVPSHWDADSRGRGGGVGAHDRRTGAHVELVTEAFRGNPGAFARRRLEAARGATALVIGPREAENAGMRWADAEAIWTRDPPRERTVQRFFTSSGMGFQLSCSAADSSFETARPTCAAILGSFRLTP